VLTIQAVIAPFVVREEESPQQIDTIRIDRDRRAEE